MSLIFDLLDKMTEEAKREAFEERAAIMEFDGGMSREEAERAAHLGLYGRLACIRAAGWRS